MHARAGSAKPVFVRDCDWSWFIDRKSALQIGTGFGAKAYRDASQQAGVNYVAESPVVQAFLGSI